jgi:hypothetical protein
MRAFLARLVATLTAVPRRVRLANSLFRVTVRYIRTDRPLIDTALRAAGLPYDSTPARLLLWRALRSLPETIREHERLFVETQRRFDECEPFLRVARSDAVALYEWQGPASVDFVNRSLSGTLAVRWDGSRVSGSLEHGGSVRTGPLDLSRSSPGRLRGPEALGTALLPGAVLEGISGEFLAIGTSATSSFTARRLTRTVRPGTDVFHRYCFRGGRLHGWASWTERMSSRTSKGFRTDQSRDSFDVILFERRARITQVHEDKHDQRKQVLGIVLEGDPLDEREKRLLWLVFSFVVGNRVQPISIEHFDAGGICTQVSMLSAVEYGEQSTSPPFDLRITEPTFAAPDFVGLTNGFDALEHAGYPIAEALHHLHDSNTGYTQVEMKNLLFCIHTLFEAWTKENDQREIISEAKHNRLRKLMSSELDRVFGVDTEIRVAVQSAVRTANDRVGAQLQEAFFDSLGLTLSETDLRALRRRNSLFHNGYLVPKRGQSQLDFYQELVEDAATLRTLAHIAILKLARYNGTVFDYRSWMSIDVTSGYP